MRKRKPTVAGLKRELEAVQRDFDQELKKNVQLLRDLREAQTERDEAVENFRRSDKQVGWYERQREETLQWFEESLRLVAPQLVPNPHTGSVDLAGTDPIERLLIETRQRLSRYYDSMGRNLYSRP